ncbi:putative calponin domain, EF-hand domain, EF-hand domain pair, CH domain superfamily [Plasmopara halstedii]
MSYQVSSVFLQKFSPKEIHELKRVFKEHDNDYAAAVSVNELPTVLQKLGENVTPNQTNVMLQQIKLERPDQISFHEFLELLYDFRNGAIALDPVLLMEHASVTPTPKVAPVPVPVASSGFVETTPVFANRKTSASVTEPTYQTPTFVQKAQWPPTGTPSTPTSSSAPVVHKPQWSSTGTQGASWGHTPSSASQMAPPITVPSTKAQWPPVSEPSTPPAPVRTGKWSSPNGDKSTITSQWPPRATSPSVTKPQWPPTSDVASKSSVTGKDSPTIVSPKPQWPPSASSITVSPKSPSDAPKRAQWPPASSSPVPPPVVRTPPISPATEFVGKTVDAHTLNVLQRRASAAAQYNSTIHEVKGTAGGVHSYSEEETVAFTEHINNVLHADNDVASLMPIGVDGGLFRAVCDGVLLCKLINAAVPETIDERALNFVKRTKELNVYQKTENQNLCINAAKTIGCSVVNIGPDDLIEGKPILVLGIVWQIIKIQLTSTINLKNHPELMRLLLDGETLEAFMKLPPDQILLRWMNYHLKAAGHPKKVTNFSTDVQDASAYSVLLHHIAPQHCDLCNESIPEERAAHVIQNARRLKVETFIKPRDITSGNPKLNMSFVAQLFNTCPALDVIEEERKQLEEILYDDVGDTREERVFRMWINSLAIDDVYINHLYSDLSDGMKLLKVLDKIQKGIVAWNKVNMVAPNKFKQVENCNYCVVLGKQLKFSLVNVGGADIFEGAKKMILSIVWQSMRYQQLKILSELAAGRGEITDKDIIAWANNKVRQNGRVQGNIVSFRDPSLADGLYLLDLVHAVEPRAVNWDMVLQDKADDAKASNAKYAISCAQKIGATVFLTFEDIVEVKPKMMMTFVASLMLVDHQRS